MDELKTCCHINMSPWGDGWEPRIWRGGQQPRSTAQRPKGEHEMPISNDNPDAHAFWHCMHLAMFTGLPVAFKKCEHSLVFILFLTLFLPSNPKCWSINLSYFRSLCFYPGLLLPQTVFCTSHLSTFSRDLCRFSVSFLSFLSLCTVFVMYTLIILC